MPATAAKLTSARTSRAGSATCGIWSTATAATLRSRSRLTMWAPTQSRATVAFQPYVETKVYVARVATTYSNPLPQRIDHLEHLGGEFWETIQPSSRTCLRYLLSQRRGNIGQTLLTIMACVVF